MIVTVYLWIDSDILIIKLNFQCTQPLYCTSEDGHMFDKNMQWS